jgi:hypothetical protein
MCHIKSPCPTQAKGWVEWGTRHLLPVGFLFADPENPGIVISEAFYTTEFMLVNRKFKLAFAPIKLMLLSTSSGRKGQRNGLFNKD